MFLSVKHLILLGSTSKKQMVLLCVVCGDDHAGSYFFSPRTFLLTLLQVERIVGKNDTPSQVETMTNEAMGGWETSNRQMRSSL